MGNAPQLSIKSSHLLLDIYGRAAQPGDKAPIAPNPYIPISETGQN